MTPAAAKTAGKKTPMSATHKGALAKGREEGRIVRNYLEALESSRPKRGRKRTPESIEKRLVVIDAAIPGADPLTRLHLIQEQNDLEAELNQSTGVIDMDTLEMAFVKVAKAYGSRKGISYSAWRTVGVNPAVLKKAGIARKWS